MNESDLRTFRTRFGIPISDEEIADAPFYRPPDDSPELEYLRERRKALGGYVPTRKVRVEPLKAPLEGVFDEFLKGTGGRKASTTMVFVRILSKLLRDKDIGDLIVPIVPDEARTFGMESLFRAVGIYSHVGQKYEPVDMDTLLYYKEAQDGQILEEGITEAGSMSSFIAAGTAYATHGVNTIPFFIYYSMFGFQRVGDLIWAAARLARPRLPARRHGRPHDARRRRAAAPGRPHARHLAVGAELHLVRSGVRLRAGGHHRGRHPPDVQGAGERLLLPDGDERAVRDAGDARGRARRHPEGALSIQAGGERRARSCKAQLLGSGAILNEVLGGAEAAREVRRRRRRVERDQLPGALSRRPRLRSLEHAAPERDSRRCPTSRSA